MAGELLAQDFLLLEAHRQQLEARQWESLEGIQSRQAVAEVHRAHSLGVLERRLERGERERQRTVDRNQALRDQASFHQRQFGRQTQHPDAIATIGGQRDVLERIRGSRESFNVQVEQMTWQYHQVVEEQMRQELKGAREDAAHCQARQNELLQAACRQEELLQQLVVERQRALEERSKLYAFDSELQTRQKSLRARLAAQRAAVDRQIEAAGLSDNRSGAVVGEPAAKAADGVRAPATAACAAQAAQGCRRAEGQMPVQARAPAPPAGLTCALQPSMEVKPRGNYVPPQGTRQFEVYQRLKNYELEMQSDLRVLEAAGPPSVMMRPGLTADWCSSRLSARAFEPRPEPPLVVVQQPHAPGPAYQFHMPAPAWQQVPLQGTGMGTGSPAEDSSWLEPGPPATGSQMCPGRAGGSLAAVTPSLATAGGPLEALMATACQGAPSWATAVQQGDVEVGRADGLGLPGSLIAPSATPGQLGGTTPGPTALHPAGLAGACASTPAPVSQPGLPELLAWAQAPRRQCPDLSSTPLGQEALSAPVSLGHPPEGGAVHDVHFPPSLATRHATGAPLEPCVDGVSMKLLLQPSTSSVPVDALAAQVAGFGPHVGIDASPAPELPVGPCTSMLPDLSTRMAEVFPQRCPEHFAPAAEPVLQPAADMSTAPPASLSDAAVSSASLDMAPIGIARCGAMQPPDSMPDFASAITAQVPAKAVESSSLAVPPEARAGLAIADANVESGTIAAPARLPGLSSSAAQSDDHLPLAYLRVSAGQTNDALAPEVGVPVAPQLPSLMLPCGEFEGSFKPDSSGEVDMDAWIPLSSRDRTGLSCPNSSIASWAGESKSSQPSLVTQPQPPPPRPLAQLPGAAAVPSDLQGGLTGPLRGVPAPLEEAALHPDRDSIASGPGLPGSGLRCQGAVDAAIDGARGSESMNASFTFADGSPLRQQAFSPGRGTEHEVSTYPALAPTVQGLTEAVSAEAPEAAGAGVPEAISSSGHAAPAASPALHERAGGSTGTSGTGEADAALAAEVKAHGESRQAACGYGQQHLLPGRRGGPTPWRGDGSSGGPAKAAVAGLAELDGDEIAGSDSGSMEELPMGRLPRRGALAKSQPLAAEVAAKSVTSPAVEQPPPLEATAKQQLEAQPEPSQGCSAGNTTSALRRACSVPGLEDESDSDDLMGSLEAPTEGSSSPLSRMAVRRANPLARGRGRGQGRGLGLRSSLFQDKQEGDSPTDGAFAGGSKNASLSSSLSSFSSLRPKAKPKGATRSGSSLGMLGEQIDWNQAEW